MMSKALLILLLGVSIAVAQSPGERRPKKLIAAGWDQVDCRRLKDQLAAMEERPFDGVVLHASGQRPQGRPCPMQLAFSAEPWQQEWFQPCVDDLRMGKSKRLTDNFVLLGANPGDVDWFDDAGWRNIVEHWRIAAWLAREGGLKGILFDPEPYSPPHCPFIYHAQPGRKEHTFDQYRAKVRQRGREIMTAVAKEFPEATIFCYFIGSVNVASAEQANPQANLTRRSYGLFPAVLDGWLDAAPPTITLIDGCEDAYLFNSRQEYLEAAVHIKGTCQNLVAPENRAKYRSQVQVGFGVYLDAYWNPKDSPWGRWYVDGRGGSRVDRLRANATAALDVADQYVWVYGEKYRWWPTPNRGVRKETWPEVLPDCQRALAWARDPAAHARSEIALAVQSGKLVNLAVNGDFGKPSQADRAPQNWGFWQKKGSPGKFTWDRDVGATGKGSARVAGTEQGCFMQAIPVRPGERYAVRAMCKVQGRGAVQLTVRWQTPEEREMPLVYDRTFLFEGVPGRWGEVFGTVEVPATAGRLAILLGADNQATPDDVVWFDDVGVFKIP